MSNQYTQWQIYEKMLCLGKIPSVLNFTIIYCFNEMSSFPTNLFKFAFTPGCEITFNKAFDSVTHAMYACIYKCVENYF